MNDDITIRSPGLRGFVAEAREIADQHWLWIVLGSMTGVGVGMVLPGSIEGLLLAPIVATVILGAFVWSCRWQRGEVDVRPPLLRLVLLGVALSSLQLPLIAFAYMTQMLVGLLMLGFMMYVQVHTSPIVAMWFAVLLQALPFVPYLLLFCFAPVFVAAEDLPVSRAIAASLRLWWRNCAAFLGFLVLGLLAASWRALPLWAMVANPFAAVPAQILGQVVSGVILIPLLAAFYVRAVSSVDADHKD